MTLQVVVEAVVVVAEVTVLLMEVTVLEGTLRVVVLWMEAVEATLQMVAEE